jgi:hypothetical protein
MEDSIVSLSLIKNFIDVQISLLTSFAPRTGFGVPLFIGETGALGTAVTGGTYSQTTTVVTVTKASHGLVVGQIIDVDALTGTGVDGRYVVATVPTTGTFTYTAGTSLSTTGNITYTPVSRVASYASLAEVELKYTNTTAEYLASQAFFAQGGNAKQLLIGYKLATETYSQALTAIQAVRDDFYAVAIQDDTKANQLLLGATIQALAGRKIVFFRTSDANTLVDGNTTDVGSSLKALDNDYAHVTYHYNVYSSTNTIGAFPEMAIIGRVLPIVENQFQAAGSTAWHNQKVVGQVSSFNPALGKLAFTQTERNTLNFKNVEAFETDGSNVRTLGGKMAGGEWGDVIHGTAWLETRLEEDLYFLLTQQADRFAKVGYDTKGIASVEQVIRSRLQKAVGTRLIDTDFTVTTPSVELTEATDRANRLYKASFEARLIGAIKFMTITGTVTV